MRFLYLILFFSFCALTANAQFGVAAKFDNNSYDTWNGTSYTDLNGATIKSDDWFNTNVTIGLNYWFRIKSKRIEFLPELLYSIKQSEDLNAMLVTGLSNQRLGFKFNTHIYPLDFTGDCNCPTWGKDSDFMKKGFFLVLSPGVDYLMSEVTYSDGAKKVSTPAFNLGLGAGVDIGVSNLLTISPFVMLNFYPNVSGEHVDALYGCNTCPTVEPLAANSSNRQIQFGLRFSFRPDYKF